MISPTAPFGQARVRPLAWETLTKLEPRLLLIEAELLASPPPHGQRFWIAYEAAKHRAAQLVGWFADSEFPVVGSSDAYEVAIDRILNILERPRGRRGARS
jgi:hypothetical protein